jgi:hypothetical protein
VNYSGIKICGLLLFTMLKSKEYLRGREDAKNVLAYYPNLPELRTLFRFEPKLNVHLDSH